MRPYSKSIIDLFDGKKRYLVPLYQRQYAWKVSPQLELLWEDIERAVEKLASGRTSIAPHFMGAIVIAEIKTFDKQVRAYEVIDGQQRLTTFQLLLAALRDVALANKSNYASEVSKYLLNDGVMETPQVERYKLWPTLTDRRAYVALMDPKADLTKIGVVAADEDGVVRLAVAAQSWFRSRIEQHVGTGDAFDEFRLEKLFEALKNGLATVSIELEGGDDPQTIFETLNSRGVDLSAGDLMRNFIFQRAKGMGQKDGSLTIDDLYSRYWLPLDHWFWREGETRGRQSRERLDWLLVDHLSMKRADLISVENLFESYRRWILNDEPFESVNAELQSIASSASIHRQITDGRSDNVLGRFGMFSRAFDVSTTMPLVLYLATEAKLDDSGLSEALGMLESLILRRDICGLPTAGYNRLFVSTIDRLRASETDTISELRQQLSAATVDTFRWPRDQEWRTGWLGRDQYKSNRQPRLRYIFEALEKRKRTVLSEEIEIRSPLSIEHILPQKWRDHWPVPGFDHMSVGEGDLDKTIRELDREHCVNKLGNLTLLTSPLNSKNSNAEFAVKLPLIRAHASLALNRELNGYQHWDETTVTARGTALFETARQIWLSPDTANDVEIDLDL